MVVVGAGHNALVAAAYLAEAGYRVGVFERQARIGGAVVTEEVVPGYRFDLGGSAHILIRLTPIVEELGLARYGLEYIDLDPLFFSPGGDGPSVFFYRDVERTADHLERLFPSQGEAYRAFVSRWTPFARLMAELFQTEPGPWQIGRRVLRGGGFGTEWTRAVSEIARPYGAVLDAYFTEPRIVTPMVWMAAQSGPPPGSPLSAPFVLWHPLYHESGVARPRGGSGMLTQALAAHVRAHGGEIHLGRAVQRIVVRNGRAVGVTVEGGDVSARAVLSGAHAHETFDRLLPREHRPKGAARMRTGNGFGAVLRLALDRPVRYAAHAGPEARVALQLLCRDREQIDRAYGHYLAGRPAADPPLVAMTFSAVDPTLAPPGHEVLWLWGQYFPYALREGTWTDHRAMVADSILAAFERYAPGVREAEVGRLFQDPEWLEAHLGLVRGNVMHLDMGLDQMFGWRPFPGGARYRAPLRGLYLTGASTHPGGGIMGASGRSAARVLLKDLSRGRLRA